MGVNKYRITYMKGLRGGVRIVEADTVNGFQPTCDTYLFKIGAEIVAAIPKVNVLSVEKIAVADDDL